MYAQRQHGGNDGNQSSAQRIWHGLAWYQRDMICVHAMYGMAWHVWQKHGAAIRINQ
jgi:hypothetical protein